MADMEARREARRRKILENSENRLKRISGVEEKTTKSELDGIKLNTYENETESSRLLYHSPDIPTDTSAEKLDGIYSLGNNVTTNSPELETIFQNPRSVANDSVSNCYVDIVEHKNYRNVFILAMPILLSFILVLFDFFHVDPQSFYLNKIFVPLIIYEIVEYFFGRSANNSPNFLTSVLLLTNVRSNRLLTNFVEHFQTFLNIVQDIMIYFFLFTVSYWLFQIVLV